MAACLPVSSSCARNTRPMPPRPISLKITQLPRRSPSMEIVLDLSDSRRHLMCFGNAHQRPAQFLHVGEAIFRPFGEAANDEAFEIFGNAEVQRLEAWRRFQPDLSYEIGNCGRLKRWLAGQHSVHGRPQTINVG